MTFEDGNTCAVEIEAFSVYDGICCNLNVDCQSICCLDGVCIPNEPCPNFDGSVDEYELKNFHNSVDQELIDQNEDSLENTDEQNTDENQS